MRFARLISAFCVRLSPPQSRTITTAPRRTKYTLYPGPQSTRSSETPPPTSLTSPKLPACTRTSRSAIRARPCPSLRARSHAANSAVWRTSIKCDCIIYVTEVQCIHEPAATRLGPRTIYCTGKAPRPSAAMRYELGAHGTSFERWFRSRRSCSANRQRVCVACCADIGHARSLSKTTEASNIDIPIFCRRPHLHPVKPWLFTAQRLTLRFSGVAVSQNSTSKFPGRRTGVRVFCAPLLPPARTPRMSAHLT